VQQRARDKARQPHGFGQRCALRNVGARGHLLRIQHGAAQQKVHQLQRDLVEHDGGQNFIDIQARLKQPSNPTPNRPGQRTTCQGDWQ